MEATSVAVILTFGYFGAVYSSKAPVKTQPVFASLIRLKEFDTIVKAPFLGECQCAQALAPEWQQCVPVHQPCHRAQSSLCGICIDLLLFDFH